MLVDAERVADGCAAHARWRDTLAQIERADGVAAPIVVGVGGGEQPARTWRAALVQSLATLSCFCWRQAYFRASWRRRCAFCRRA